MLHRKPTRIDITEEDVEHLQKGRGRRWEKSSEKKEAVDQNGEKSAAERIGLRS